MTGYKVLTHDYRPPLQGGDPIWDGVTLPYQLPPVVLDESEADCAPGWHYCEHLADAFQLCGLWPSGWPSEAVVVEPGPERVERGAKARAASLTIVRRATDGEIEDAVLRLSEPFGGHADAMAAEQFAWREALGRPRYEPSVVEEQLRAALHARELAWELKQYPSARAARAAWATRDARAVWGDRATWAAMAGGGDWAARDAMAAMADRVTWAARATMDAWAGWGPTAAWAARDARDAWAARAALTVLYAALNGWIDGPADLLTVGIRDAYRHGLAVALPVADGILGWAMEDLTEGGRDGTP